jgi:hypothetical protein
MIRKRILFCKSSAFYCAGIIISLIFTLFSCNDEKGIPVGAGASVPVRIFLSARSDKSESSLRASSQSKASKLIVHPVGNGMLLEMRAEEEISTTLRNDATSSRTFAVGVKLRIIVLDASEKFYSYADYTVTNSAGGELSPDPGFGLKVQENNSYYFICLSLNTESLPNNTSDYIVGASSLPTLPVDLSMSLLWWKSPEPVAINSHNNSLSIAPAQQFTKVKVIFDGKYNQWPIANVDNSICIGEAAVEGNFDLITGLFLSEEAGDIPFTGWTYSTTDLTAECSDLPLLLTSKRPVLTLPAGSITLEKASLQAHTSVPLTTTSIPLALEKGKSYVFHIRIRTPKFASSNIYWDQDENRLTFKPYSDNPADDYTEEQRYQGLFFKWGSLVGIAPSETLKGEDYGTLNFESGKKDNPNKGTPIYVPLADGNWMKTNACIQFGVGENKTGAEVWNTIPYVVDTTTLGIENRQSISDFTVEESLATFRGDICRYLAQTGPDELAGYRMPTFNEFGTQSTPFDWKNATTEFVWKRTGNANWGKFNSPGDLIGVAGRRQISTGGLFGLTESLFPASGGRNSNTPGALADNTQVQGIYWNSTPSGKSNGKILSFNVDKLETNLFFFSSALPVRCVLE